MIKSIVMPKLTQEESTGFIAKWFVEEGDRVKSGDKLCRIETGKLVQTIMSDGDGVVKKIAFKKDATVNCRDEIAIIETLDTPEAMGEIRLIDVVMVGNACNQIQKWYVKAGDTVKSGDRIYGIEGGKGTQDVNSDFAGKILEILISDGEMANGGEAIARMEISGVDASADRKSVVIIGGGPGGYVAAIRAAQLGADVTLIEKEKLGGTCLHKGCIPTKALLHSAELYDSVREGARAGIIAQNVTLDWKKVQDNKKKISKRMSLGIKSLFEANGVKLVEGTAKFLNSTTLQVATTDGGLLELTADRIIVATGSQPFMPPIPGVRDNADCIDSTGALSLEQLPWSMVIIGGGVIGVELACTYALMGVNVTVVEMMPRIMPTMDYELTMIAQKQMESIGIEFMLEAQVLSVSKENESNVVKVRTPDGLEKNIAADKVLVAVGRRADCSGINIEAAGVELELGHIVTNDRMETNVSGIYAIGDCAGRTMLAHTASAMGEIAAENSVGGESKYNEDVCPACVYIHPEFASVGLTEEKAKENGVNYVVGKFPLIANGKSVIMGSTCGWIKIVAGAKSGRILGVHILGPRATDIIAEGVLAIKMRATAQDLIATIHAHPTVAEAVREAALSVQGRSIHFK